MVSSLQGGLCDFCCTWLRCNSLEWNSHSTSQHLALHAKNRTLHLEWNSHSTSQHLALHAKNRTLHLVQLPDLGSVASPFFQETGKTCKILQE